MKALSLEVAPMLFGELSRQARRPGPERWSYPGPSWFLVALLGPALLCQRAGPEAAPLLFFLFSALLHAWQLGFRSTLYASTSMARDVSAGAFLVLAATPWPLGQAVAAKLAASLLPLWLEIGGAGLFWWACHGWGQPEPIPAALIASVALFQITLTLFFGGLGLWLGGALREPGRTARSARLLVLVLVLATALGPDQVNTVLVLTGLLLWFCLVWIPQFRPGQAVQGSLAALTLLLLLPILFTATRDHARHLDLTSLNPLHTLRAAVPASASAQTDPLEGSSSGLLEASQAARLAPLACLYLIGGVALTSLASRKALSLR